jgi:hypothetical protein
MGRFTNLFAASFAHRTRNTGDRVMEGAVKGLAQNEAIKKACLGE